MTVDDDNPGTPSHTGSGGDLHGWKEIANYLGKSVRAAQRWEEDLGLPVHRLRTAAGQTIYARRAEIDEWRRRQSIPPGQATAEPRDDPPAAEPAPVPTLRRRSFSWAGAGVSVTALIAIVAVGYFFLGRAAAVPPTAFAFTHDALEARSAAGELVWRHVFPRPVVAERPVGVAKSPRPAPRVRVADLDGDGEPEVVAVVSYADQKQYGDELYCFSLSGKLRWRHRPEMDLAFGAGTFQPPWLITAISVAGSRVPDASDVYIAVVHDFWWPSAVIRVQPDGTAEPVLIHSGHIYEFFSYEHEGVQYIAAGGINNEFASAALAILSTQDGPVQSPQLAASEFACRGCPGTMPLRYYLFGQAEIGRVSDSPYNRIAGGDVLPDGLRIHVLEDLEASASETYYRFTPAGEILGAQVGDGYWQAHRRHESQGRLDHASRDCPERTREVRVFRRDAGWTAATVRVEGPVPGGIKP